jgi:molybdopterin biosynthesis enzyme
MIRTMLGTSNIHRPSIKAKLEKSLSSKAGERAYIRALLSEDGKSVIALEGQDDLTSLSDANSLIALSEKDIELAAGDLVSVVVLERRYI